MKTYIKIHKEHRNKFQNENYARHMLQPLENKIQK